MLHVGLDLSRRRLDYLALTERKPRRSGRGAARCRRPAWPGGPYDQPRRADPTGSAGDAAEGRRGRAWGRRRVCLPTNRFPRLARDTVVAAC